jgi:hypothetical protein
VEALRKVGAKVHYIKEPVDLVVGFRGRNVLLEIKNPDGFDKVSTEQQEFIDGWPGEVHVVRDVAEAMNAVLGKEVMK